MTMGSSLSADVAVLGGGLVGTSVAYELAQAGLAVTLIDAAHSGRASDAGAGIASPETFHDPDESWFDFGQSAARHLRTLTERLGEDGAAPEPEAFERCGSLVLALSEHEDPWFAEALERAASRSPDVVEIAPDQASAMFPPLGSPHRAFYSPAAARLDGRKLCRAIRIAAQERGTTIVSMEAIGFDRAGDRVTAVLGERGAVKCDALVIAGGAWSSQAVRCFDFDLRVQPMKGQIVHLAVQAPTGSERDVPTDRWPIVQPILNFYLVPWPGGRVACGGTFEAEAGFDTRPTVGGVRDLLRECVVIAPGLAEATVLEVRVGLRPTSADDRPLLGQLPGMANVHVCTGHGANGLLLGPYSAALVAAGILGERSPALAKYAVARLATAP